MRSSSLAAVESQQQFVADDLQHGVGILKHVVVPETDQAIAELFDDRRPGCVSKLGMLPPVELDGEMRLTASEVRNVGSDGKLSLEFGAFETPSAKVIPETLLGVGAVRPKLSSYRRQSFFRQRGCPSPQPSPRRGEGVRACLRSTVVASVLTLTACATAQLHTEAQLNQVALGCGLSYGEVVQEAEEKRLLFLYRFSPKPEQRRCVYEWAHRNHLTLVVINAVNEPTK